MAAGGLTGVNTHPVYLALLFMILSPVIGLIFGFLITLITVNLARNSRPVKAEKWFKRLQLVSSGALSLAHGGGDSQKTMGLILTAIWFYNKRIHGSSIAIADMGMPDWLPLACYSAIALGTMSGGWRIVKTMGTRITKVTPLEGVCAETAGAFTIFLTIVFGIPVSTTHTLTGAIVGVGATKRLSAVRWGVTYSLIWAWVLTIPVSAVVAAIAYFIIHFITG
jgi:PiT family inorganic phosphate transporter